jgi:hypothetical protein
MPDLDPSERLTLAEQLRLLVSQGMPEADAAACLGKAFRLREITYQPQFAFSYEDAKIDWDTGRVRLSRGSRNPFTPTLTAAEFLSHFLPSSGRPDASTTAQAALRACDSAQAASRPRAVRQFDSIPLIEAVHDLRIICNSDLHSAIGEMIDLLATGQLPPADALVDGVPVKIDPVWWWVGAIEYPNSSAAFNLFVDGEERRLTRATEIALDPAVGSVNDRGSPPINKPRALFRTGTIQTGINPSLCSTRSGGGHRL